MSDSSMKNVNEAVAKEACEHARTYILMGSTQLINNSYDIEQRRSLNKAIGDIRYLSKEYGYFSLEFDAVIQKFYRIIKLCRKFSLGNCEELALMALDYVIHSVPDTNAEVYQIKGGDHAFLVIGRKKNSLSSQPETWGDDAYICDPWANKYFPARQYLAKVENYYFEKDPQTNVFFNRTQSFAPGRHKLQLVKDMNTDYLRRVCTEPHRKYIVTLFTKKSQALLVSILSLEGKMEDLAQRLQAKYGEDNEKRQIILKICAQLQLTRSIIRMNMGALNNQGDYLKFITDLEHRLQSNIKAFSQSLSLTYDDKKVLNKYQHEPTWRTGIVRFFCIHPESVRVTNNAVQVARREVTKLLKMN